MVQIICDGSCKGNPGPMGYAVLILRDGQIVREITGGSQDTGTNNIAEFKAALYGLEAAKEVIESEEEVIVISDSELLIGYMSQAWRCRNATLGRLRMSIRRAQADLLTTVTYQRGGVEDEVFQLVDTLAKDAVPQSHEEQRRDELIASMNLPEHVCGRGLGKEAE